jgi:hypothetical protein
MLKGMFRTEREEDVGDWRWLQNKELWNLYALRSTKYCYGNKIKEDEKGRTYSACELDR